MLQIPEQINYLRSQARWAFLLLCIFSSCSSTCPWIYRETLTGCDTFNSALLSYLPAQQFCAIEVQFLTGSFGTLGYLNIHGKPIPPALDSNNEVIAILEIEDERRVYRAIRMEGGQRFLLPDEAKDDLIEALLAMKKTKVYLDGYATEVSYRNFSKLYCRFSRI